MGKDHTNIRSDLPYEFPGGKCADDYKGENYKKILEDDAPLLDMTEDGAPKWKGGSGGSKKEKTY